MMRGLAILSTLALLAGCTTADVIEPMSQSTTTTISSKVAVTYPRFADNDPNGRMIALANHNSDLAEYWEWSAEGLYSEDPTNNAYRLGVNYIVYALTH